jgi:hypothetical protein
LGRAIPERLPGEAEGRQLARLVDFRDAEHGDSLKDEATVTDVATGVQASCRLILTAPLLDFQHAAPVDGAAERRRFPGRRCEIASRARIVGAVVPGASSKLDAPLVRPGLLRNSRPSALRPILQEVPNAPSNKARLRGADEERRQCKKNHEPHEEQNTRNLRGFSEMKRVPRAETTIYGFVHNGAGQTRRERSKRGPQPVPSS